MNYNRENFDGVLMLGNFYYIKMCFYIELNKINIKKVMILYEVLKGFFLYVKW